MNEENNNMKKDAQKPVEKEIDLLEVSGNIASSIKKGTMQLGLFLFTILKVIFRTAFQFFFLILNSWKFVIIVLIILGGSSYSLFKSQSPKYSSELTAISRIRNVQETRQIINSISIPKDDSTIPMRNDLQLSPEVYNNVLEIKASWLIDKNADGIADFVDYDDKVLISPEEDSITTRLNDRLNISITLLDPSVATNVEEQLLKYLNNHPYITNLNNTRLSTVEGMYNIYQNQAAVLDSLQAYEYFKNDKSQNVQSLKLGDIELIGSDDMKDKRLYHEDIITLEENAMSKQAIIQYNKEPIVFIGSFTGSSDRSNSLIFFLKKLAVYILPIALLIFVLLKRKEVEEIFNIKDFTDK